MKRVLQRLLLDLLLGIDLAMKLRDDMDFQLTSHFYSVAARHFSSVFPSSPVIGRSVSHDPMYVRDRGTFLYM